MSCSLLPATSLALHAVGIFVGVFGLLSQCVEEGRDLDGRVQWQDLVQHIDSGVLDPGPR